MSARQGREGLPGKDEKLCFAMRSVHLGLRSGALRRKIERTVENTCKIVGGGGTLLTWRGSVVGPIWEISG